MIERKKVLLVHGMLMHPIVMIYLEYVLTQENYEVIVFQYPLLPNENDLKTALIQAVKRDKPYAIIGHSLGGKAVVKYLSHMKNCGVRVVVCIGSPLKGSKVAIHAMRCWLRLFMSKYVADLLQEELEVPPGWFVGLIAGTKKEIGTRNLLPTNVFSCETEHDGTVSLNEACVPGLSDIAIVERGHTGLLFSSLVGKMVVNFLKTGHFVPEL